jgi:hypothetical protein
MHARLLRPALGLAAVSTGLLALGATAAPKPLVLTDIAGDANALNDQGLGQGVDNNATPVSEAAADIVKTTLANTFKGKKCTGFTITMEMAGDVDPSLPAIYRLLGNTTKNDGIFQIYLNNGAIADGESEIRHGAGEEDASFPMKNPAKIAGKTITFTVTDKEIKAFGDKPGNKITDFSMEVRGSSGVSFVPVIDQLDASDKSFTMCG